MSGELQYHGNRFLESGLTVTAEVFNSSGSQIGGSITCSELGTTAKYYGDMPTAPPDVYTVTFINGVDDYLTQGVIYWNGSKEIDILSINDDLVVVDSLADSIKSVTDNIPDAGSLNDISAILEDTSNTIPSQISALNNVSVSEVESATLVSLNAYDPPTKAELDSAQSAVQGSIAGLNNFNPTSDQVIVATNNDKTGYFISGSKTTIDQLNDFDSSVDKVVVVTNEDKTGYSILGTISNFDQLDANQDAQHLISQNLINSLNNLSSADVTAAVPTTSQIEAALIDDGDGQQLINAIVTNIGNQNIDEIALVAAIRADLERSGGTLDSLPILTEIEASNILAKSSQISALNNFDHTTDQVIVSLNNDKVGYSILGTKTNLDALVDFNPALNQVIVGTNNDKTGYSIDGSKTRIDDLNDFDSSVDKVIVVSNEDKTGYSIAGTIINLDQLDAAQDAEHLATQNSISNLNDFDPATEVIANLVKVNSVSVANIDDFKADISALSLSSEVLSIPQSVWEYDVTGVVTEGLSGKELQDASGGASIGEGDIHAALDSYLNKSDYKADVSLIETKAEADARQALLIAEHNQTQIDVSNSVNYDDSILIGKVDVIDSNVDLIKFKTDTLVNTDISSLATQSSIDNLNNFDPATDTVARVTLVDTTTINTDMRGTDGANTVIPPTTAEIEAALLNEGDGQQLIDAIVLAIGNTNLDQVAVVAAIRADLERSGGLMDLIPVNVRTNLSTELVRLDANVSSRLATSGYTVPDNSGISSNGSAISALNDVSVSQIRTELSTELSRIDASVSSRLPTSSYTSPDNAGIAANGTAIENLNDISAVDVRAELSTELARIDDDITSRQPAGEVDANITKVNSVVVTDIDDFKADNVDLGTVPADVTAIKAKTDQLVFTGSNVNAVLQNSIIPADMCKVFLNIFNPNDKPARVDQVFNQLSENTAKIKDSYYDTSSSKSFTVYDVNPNFDSSTGQAFWILPRGATVSFSVGAINIFKDIIVPDSETADLNLISEV